MQLTTTVSRARAAGALVVLAAALAFAPAAHALSNTIVISQVYGGGGNTGATYTHDFIELINRGTTPVSINGWSVQYASATGTTWQLTNLSGTLQPGQYYLVQQAQGSGGIQPLPTPDAIGVIPMSATNGKVALVNHQTMLSGACPSGSAIIDFIGYGTANCFETAAAPGLTNTTAAHRGSQGCVETDNNSSDFTAAAPTPRNSASPFNNCNPVPVEEGSWGRIKSFFR